MKMDVQKSKVKLEQYFNQEGRLICDLHKELNSLTDEAMAVLLNGYIEYILLKTLASDIGSEEFGGMRLSASPDVDALWHTHVLCTENYAAFMSKLKEINPLVETLHHSLKGSIDAPEVKARRRDATMKAYRRVFGEDCSWLSVRQEPETDSEDGGPLVKSRKRALPEPKTQTQLSGGNIHFLTPPNQLCDVKVYIIKLNGGVFTFQINVNCTVGALKEGFCDIGGYPTCQIQLLFQGKPIWDERTLSSYNIKNEDIIDCKLVLSGC